MVNETRSKKLADKITQAAEAYYSSGSTIMTDDQFDLLVNKLRSEDPNHPVLNTPGWGYTPKKHKVKHQYGKVGSLKKVFDIEAIPFIDEALSMPKLDGLTCVAYYKNGELDYAATRGDGEVAVDITHHMSRIIPKRITNKEDFAVRGEVLFSKTTYEQKYSKDYSNSRNLASGTVMSLEISNRVLDLHFVAFGYHSPTDLELDKELDCLKTYGFRTVAYLSETSTDAETIKNWVYSLDYQVDGAVIATKDKSEIVALKFESQNTKVIVKSINWSLGGSGRVVPVLQFEPVELMDTMVSQAYAHSFANLIDRQVGIGAEFLLVKSGDIIPHVKEVLSKSTFFGEPTNCPSCDEILDTTKAHLICKNKANCPEQNKLPLKRYFEICGIPEGIGDKYFDYFFENTKAENLLRYIGGSYRTGFLYKLPDNSHMKKMFIQLLDNVAKRNEGGYTFEEFWYFIGIDGLSKKKATALSDIDPRSDYIPEELPVSKNVREGIEEFNNWIKDTAKVLKFKELIAKEETAKTNHVWCITGKLSIPRKKIETALTSVGVSVMGAVNKKTTALICNEPSSSSKYKNAEKLGIPIYTETQAMEEASVKW